MTRGRRLRAAWLAAALVAGACSGGSGSQDSSSAEAPPLPEVPAGPAGDAFYQPPDPLPAGDPGAPIWAVPVGAPAGAVGWKVLYQSRAVDGSPIAVSGLVFAPQEKGSDRPVISFGHGMVGLGDSCAPSKTFTASDDVQLPYLSDLIERGFVVAATDYEGLGPPGVHPFVVGESEGRSMLDAARTAALIPGTGAGSRVVVAGHSQGGHAALFAGELAATYAPELDLRGVLASAAPSDLRLIAGVLDDTPYFGYLPMAAAGFRAAYPDLPLDAVLTPEAIAELPEVEASCVEGALERYAGRDRNDVIVASPGAVEPWASRLDENSAGHRPAGAPLLLVHGTADEVIPSLSSRQLHERYCAFDDDVERKLYEDATHLSVLLEARDDMLDWIEDRAAGRDADGNCL